MMNKLKIIKEFVNKQENETFLLDYPFKVIYKKVSEPVSFVAFFTKIGSIYEKEEYKGIAHLIEHCVFRGSKNFPQDISKIINNLGGYINAYTSYDQTVYYINLPSYSVFQAMEILWDMIFHPLFRKEDIESERNIIFHEINMRDDDPPVVIFEETLKRMYVYNPLRHPIIGYHQTLKNINENSIIEFYNYYQNPKNSFFVIVSDLEINKIREKLDDLFKDCEISSNSPVLDYKIDEKINTEKLHLKGKVNKTYMMISYKSPTLLEKYKDIEKTYYLSMISYILAGSSYGILNRILKNDLKIVDAVNFDVYTTNELPGIIYFSAITDSSNIQKIVENYSKIVKNLSSYIELDYFEVVKENFFSSSLWNFETSSNQGMLIGSNELFKTYKEAYTYFYKIDKITFNDMLEVFYEYVNEKDFLLSVYEKE